MEKPLREFHRQPTGPMGRHSWCRTCANSARRGRPAPTREQARRWNLTRRYRLSPAKLDEMMAAQAGRCAICRRPMARVCVDHDHATGVVRGLLCHGCNIKLPAVETTEYREAALRYLRLK